MFLDLLSRRNPELIAAAVELHQAERIPANSYVVDLDAVEQNAQILADEARRQRLDVFVMTKQFGRNPPVMDAAKAGGVGSFVAMDVDCARAIGRAGHRLAHVGHLIQVPRWDTQLIGELRPDYWTVFNRQQAERAAAVAQRLGRTQPLLLRMTAPEGATPPLLDGGFPADRLEEAVEELATLPGATVAGVTMYPGLSFDPRGRRLEPSANVAFMEQMVTRLHALGLAQPQVNAPGETSTAALGMLAAAGVTQVEPGHGLTGTTPLHAARDLPERPAMLYLSEVSHLLGTRAYCFGGGLYVCVGQHHAVGNAPQHALVGRDGVQVLRNRVRAHIPPPPAIDFYGTLDLPGDVDVRPGDSVVWGFRAQAFVTRALIVPLRGVRSGNPVVQGFWSADGHLDERSAVPVR